MAYLRYRSVSRQHGLVPRVIANSTKQLTIVRVYMSWRDGLYGGGGGRSEQPETIAFRVSHSGVYLGDPWRPTMLSHPQATFLLPSRFTKTYGPIWFLHCICMWVSAIHTYMGFLLLE